MDSDWKITDRQNKGKIELKGKLIDFKMTSDRVKQNICMAPYKQAETKPNQTLKKQLGSLNSSHSVVLRNVKDYGELF